MTALLRSLDALVTSRYHAAVLSMAAAVPQIAVGHDLRLLTLYQELGLAEALFVEGAATPEAFTAVADRLERLLADPEPVREALRRGQAVHAARAGRNRELLGAFAARHGWSSAPVHEGPRPAQARGRSQDPGVPGQVGLGRLQPRA